MRIETMENRLYCDAINVQPVDFDWSDNDPDSGETRWEIVTPDPSDWSLKQCRDYLDANGEEMPGFDPWDVNSDRTALMGECIDREIDPEGSVRDSDGYMVSIDPATSDDDLREMIADAIEEDDETIGEWRDAVRDHLDENRDQFEPMMSYYYPLPGYRGDAATAQEIIAGTACVVVLVDDEPVLALAGGGMDLSPDICRAYFLLGYYPPLHFAENLPRLGKLYLDRMGKEMKDVLAACVESARIAENWARDARERLEKFAADLD
jgi:hypothetical protein